MLSKSVKQRIRFNRALRSEPAWRVAMRSYKMQQLTIVRLHVQHLETQMQAESTHPNDKGALAIKAYAKREDIANLKRQQKEMTREDWYAELDTLQGHHQDQRAWVRLLLTNEDELAGGNFS